MKHTSKGFTLSEIVVVVTLSVLLFSSLYAVYITSFQSYRRNVNRAELDQNARISLERITRDLRQTNDIVTTIPPTDTDILNPPPSHILFQDGHDTTKIQYIEYSLINGDLTREVIHYYFSTDTATWVAWDALDQFNNPPLESIDETVIKANSIQSLQFFGSPTISIKLTVANSDTDLLYQTQTLGRNTQ